MSYKTITIAFTALLGVGLATKLAVGAGETAGGIAHSEGNYSITAPSATDTLTSKPSLDTAVLAGGCFWGIEAVFENVRGVRDVISGYAGGDSADARYDLVSRDKTKHAESVRIVFDPSVVTYGTLLQIFFTVAHDPTQLNRQGPDVGKHYRSAIFYRNSTQQQIAAKYITDLKKEKVFSKSIVTQVDSLKRFYPAEQYHQDFARKNPRNPYIVAHDIPKVRALEKQFPKLFLKK